MASLLAIVLVGKSSRGASIIYSYPPVPQSVPRTSKPIYPTARNVATTSYTSEYSSESSSSNNNSDEDSENETDLDGEQINGLESESNQSAENYLGFSNNVLASLLSPNRELCDQPFELVVNHLAMIGHPVWLGDDGGTSAAPGSSTTYDYNAADEDEERGRSRRRQMEKEAILKEQQEGLGEGTLSPSRGETRRSRSRQPSSNGHPIQSKRSPSSNTLIPQASFTSSQHSHISIHGSGKLVSFNFVIIVDTPADCHLSSHLEGYYKDVIVPLTANIKALERREMWLGKETAKLRRIFDSDMEKGITPIEHLASLPSKSPLAAAISQLYTSLKSSLLATISLGSLPVQVLLRGEIPMEEFETVIDRGDRDDGEQESLGDGERARSVSPPPEDFQSRPPPLFSRLRKRPPVKFMPWETLLPLENLDEVKREVEEGTLLWRFLDICSPTLSFGEYETLLDVESEGFPLKEIVEHLVHWRKGRIIDVISLRGFYAISASFDTKLLPSLAYKFRIAFPSLPFLPILLSQIPPTDSFSSIVPIPNLRAHYLSALIWLLANDVVVKQRVYVRICIPSAVKHDSFVHWGSELSRRGGSSSVAESVTDDGPLEEGSTTSSVFDESGSVRSSEGVSSTSFTNPSYLLGVRRKGSKPDLEDSKGMAIVGGSALSISPSLLPLPLPSASRSFSRSFQNSTMRVGPIGSGGGSSTGLRKLGGKSSRRTMSTTTFSSANSVDGGDEEQKGRPSVILEPGRPSALEQRWLVEICRGKDKSIVEKFDRMVRMLNGTVHLDEIRHRATLSRKDIRLVLSAFENYFVLFTHP